MRRLIRDAHVGVLWEGTSNINALDIVTRAVGKNGNHRTLAAALTNLLNHAKLIPAAFRDRLRTALDRDAGFRRARRGRARAGSRTRGRRPARSITSPAPS